MKFRLRSVLLLPVLAFGAACSSDDDAGATSAEAGKGNTGGSVVGGGASTAGTTNALAGNGGMPASAGATPSAGGSLSGGAAGSSAAGSGAGAGGSAGGTSAGGTAGHAGGGGPSGGVTSGGTAGAATTCGNIASTATRPQLNASDAANTTILKYLAQTDNWNPTAGLGNASAFTADFTVAADGSGTHTTLQAAINAAASGSTRRHILVKPGTYRGGIVYTGATPLTIYGTDSDPQKVVLVDNKSAATAGGTPKTATLMSSSPGLQLMNLTVSNDFATPSSGSDLQAVALYVTGDKTVLENVRLHGFQDTLYTDTASDSKASRVYIRSSFIEGDTDFIFGGATLVIDSSTLHYLSSRKGTNSGVYLAPSTRVSNNFGFLVIASKFTSDASAPANKISIGRSWDQGGVNPTPNGQAVVRESTLAAHIRKADPWAAAATTGRAYSASGNRFSEYCNSGTGAGP